jgi:DNA-directed RNA polymerase omega subunit
MIERPRLDQLTDAFPSPYALVVAVAQRARNINDEYGEGNRPQQHALTMALEEAQAGTLSLHSPESAQS